MVGGSTEGDEVDRCYVHTYTIAFILTDDMWCAGCVLLWQRLTFVQCHYSGVNLKLSDFTQTYSRCWVACLTAYVMMADVCGSVE